MNKGIVKGFSVNNNRTSPRSPYEASIEQIIFSSSVTQIFSLFLGLFLHFRLFLVVWSVGLGELVKVDDAVLYPNRYFPEY